MRINDIYIYKFFFSFLVNLALLVDYLNKLFSVSVIRFVYVSEATD